MLIAKKKLKLGAMKLIHISKKGIYDSRVQENEWVK